VLQRPGCGAARGVSIRCSLLAAVPSTGLLTDGIQPVFRVMSVLGVYRTDSAARALGHF
jgi:hypothetical protein